MRMILKVTLIILLLPIVGLVSLYLTGVGMSWYLEHQQESVRAAQDEISMSGNGFGGEAGMAVVDSGYYTEQFYWLDDDHLVFNKKWIANTDMNDAVIYVWNVAANEIKPVDVYGRMFCALGTNIYFYDGDRERESPANANRFSNAMRGNLIEGAEAWKFENVQELEKIWSVPDERYEFAWARECTPWFRITSASR